jgi:oligosaccharide repeat unit polymerase
MRRDIGVILILLCGATLGVVLNDQAELEPLIFLIAAFGIFLLERVFIGDAVSFLTFRVPGIFLLGFSAIICVGLVVEWTDFDSEEKFSLLYADLATLLVFPVGVWVAGLTWKVVLLDSDRPFVGDLRLTDLDAWCEGLFWGCIALALAIVVLFFYFSINVQLVDLILKNPNALDPDWVRFAQTEIPKEMQYLFELARRVLLPLAMLYAYFRMAVDRGKWRWLFPAILTLALSVSLLTLDRSPPMAIMAMWAIAYLIVNRNRSTKWIGLGFIVTAAIVMAGVISLFQYQSNTDVSLNEVIDTSWYVLTYRIFGSPQEMALRAFETYNYDTYFLEGKFVRLFSVLGGGEYAESASFNVEVLAAAPVTFVGDLWRNWGWLGVLFGSAAYGFLLQTFQVVIFDKWTVLRSAVFVLLILGSLSVIHGNALGIVTLSVIVFTGLLGVIVSVVERRMEAQTVEGSVVRLP